MDQAQHTAIVDNPLWQPAQDGMRAVPRQITVAINVRESAISLLASRKVLDAHHVRAADRFRALWETMGGKGASAIDYSREPVDGGRIAEPIRASQLDAGKQLAAVSRLLGPRFYKLVSGVCGEGHSLVDMYPAKRQRLTATDNLRAALDDMAEMWGMRTRVHGRHVENRGGLSKSA